MRAGVGLGWHARLRVALVLLGLLLVVCGSAVARAQAALGDPSFQKERAEGLLKSDPALLYAITERVLAAHGGVPADLRADPRLQYPYGTDLAAEFTLGQEFLAAWAQLAARRLGFDPPLHLTCVWLFAFTASLAALGVFGLARELTRSTTWALFAALLWAVLPASYRTIGFVLVREDLAFPLLALALWLIARAARVETRAAWLAAGALLAAALSTWHAMGFFVALLLLGPLAWSLRTGRSPFARAHALWVLAPPIVAALLVPAMRTAGLLGSLPALLAAVLVGMGLAERRGARRDTRVLAGAAGAGLVLALSGALRLARGTRGAYAHVTEVLLAKVRQLGIPPEDPNAISFDARLLWQGPFETLAPLDLVWFLGWSLFFLGGALALGWSAWRNAATTRAEAAGAPRPVGAAEAQLVLVALLALPAAWLVSRVVILPGLLFPVLAAVVLARIPRRELAGLLAAGTLGVQLWTFVPWLVHFQSPWYQPPGRQAEIAGLVDWVRANVSPEEPIVTDFMNGPALLAHCGNPIVLQPKYETDRSRRAAERFLTAFFFGSPAEFARFVRKELHARHFLIDRYTLGSLSRWTAGLRADEPLPGGTAAELFLSQDPAVLERVAGMQLLYRSPPDIRQANGAPYDFYRLYRLDAQ